MGLVSRFGNPVGMKFRFASRDEEFVRRLERRFICRCGEIEHAPFYEVDYNATELYAKKFAFFIVRSWIRGLKKSGKSPPPASSTCEKSDQWVRSFSGFSCGELKGLRAIALP